MSRRLSESIRRKSPRTEAQQRENEVEIELDEITIETLEGDLKLMMKLSGQISARIKEGISLSRIQQLKKRVKAIEERALRNQMCVPLDYNRLLKRYQRFRSGLNSTKQELLQMEAQAQVEQDHVRDIKIEFANLKTDSEALRRTIQEAVTAEECELIDVQFNNVWIRGVNLCRLVAELPVSAAKTEVMKKIQKFSTDFQKLKKEFSDKEDELSD